MATNYLPLDVRLNAFVGVFLERIKQGLPIDAAAVDADLAVKALNKQFKADFRQKKQKVLATEAAIQGE